MAFIKVQNVVKDSAGSIVSVQPQLLRLFIYQASKITPTRGLGNVSERSFIWLKTKNQGFFSLQHVVLLNTTYFPIIFHLLSRIKS